MSGRAILQRSNARVWLAGFALCLAGLPLLAADPPPARVVSINIANNSDARTVAEEIRARTGGVPDILMLQEVPRKKGARASVADDVAQHLGLHTTFAAPKPGPTNVGVAILSRWPLEDVKVHIVPRFYKLLKIRPRIALGATVLAPWGATRLWTTHLDTRINVGERLKQLEPILADAREHVGPVILGGDLNTLSMNWLLHTVPYPSGKAHARGVSELMRRHGFVTPFQESKPTFDLFGMQLDWVYSRGLQAVKSGVEPLEFSDHHAVWVDLTVVDQPSTRASSGASGPERR